MKTNASQYGKVLHTWIVPEYITHDRSKIWYIIASIIAFIFIVYSIFTSNFLFALIIIMGAIIMVIHDGQKPAEVRIAITEQGIMVGRNFYEFNEFKSFAIVDKPYEKISNLYFEYKSAVKQRLSVPLRGNDPITIKNYLIQNIPEDKERTDIPFSEQLTRLLKL